MGKFTLVISEDRQRPLLAIIVYITVALSASLLLTYIISPKTIVTVESSSAFISIEAPDGYDPDRDVIIPFRVSSVAEARKCVEYGDYITSVKGRFYVAGTIRGYMVFRTMRFGISLVEGGAFTILHKYSSVSVYQGRFDRAFLKSMDGPFNADSSELEYKGP